MKALTLRQPWASLVAAGAKRWETRSWATRYRGPLAIHAAAGWRPVDVAHVPWPAALAMRVEDWERLPRGTVVAIAELVECLPAEAVAPGAPEALFGDFAPGRWAWRLEGVRSLDPPVPARGRLGLWEISLSP